MNNAKLLDELLTRQEMRRLDRFGIKDPEAAVSICKGVFMDVIKEVIVEALKGGPNDKT